MSIFILQTEPLGSCIFNFLLFFYGLLRQCIEQDWDRDRD